MLARIIFIILMALSVTKINAASSSASAFGGSQIIAPIVPYNTPSSQLPSVSFTNCYGGPNVNNTWGAYGASTPNSGTQNFSCNDNEVAIGLYQNTSLGGASGALIGDEWLSVQCCQVTFNQ